MKDEIHIILQRFEKLAEYFGKEHFFEPDKMCLQILNNILHLCKNGIPEDSDRKSLEELLNKATQCGGSTHYNMALREQSGTLLELL